MPYFYLYLYVVDREILHEDKFAAVDDSVTVPCHGSNAMPVVWQHKRADLDARDLYDEHGLVSTYVNKYWYSVNGSTYDLTIRNMEVADAGEYWCVEDEGFGVKHITRLFVTGAIVLLLCFLWRLMIENINFIVKIIALLAYFFLLHLRSLR